MVFHLPALATAAKVMAPLALKKLAVSKIINKLGPERAVGELRKVNDHLRRGSPSYYPPKLADKTSEGLDALEDAVSGVRGQEAVARWWQWYERLEKDNPTLANAVIKSYVETLPGMRWATALLRGAAPAEPPPPPPPATAGASSDVSLAARAASAAGDARGQRLLRQLHEAHPELSDYHVILVPKPRGDDAAEKGTAGGREEGERREGGETPPRER